MIISSKLSNIYANCTLYSANCSYILLDEFNLFTSAQMSDTNYYGEQIGLFYYYILNNYPNNISTAQYDWQGNIWQMINETDKTFYPPFNVTKNFATYSPSGSTVYSSSSNESNLKTVTCKKGNSRNLIIINTDTETKNITLNLTNSGITTLYNLENTSQTWTPSTNTQIGLLDSYDIFYLGEDLQKPDLTINSPSNLNYSSVNSSFNVTLSEEGDTCKYTLNKGVTNYTMTKTGYTSFFSAINLTMYPGIHTIKYWCNDTFNNINNTQEVNFSVGFGKFGNIYWYKGSDSINNESTSDYTSFNNTATSNKAILIYSLTNALIYNSNGSIFGSSNINNNDGNINITLNSKNKTFVINNYYLYNGLTRENDPINITQVVTDSYTKTYHISSQLNNLISIDVYNLVVPTGYRLTSLTVQPNGLSSYTPIYTYNKVTGIINIENVNLTYSSSSNEIILGITNEVQDDLCTDFYLAGNNFTAFIVVIIILMIAGFLLFLFLGGNEIDLATGSVIVLISGIIITLGMVIIKNINHC